MMLIGYTFQTEKKKKRKLKKKKKKNTHTQGICFIFMPDYS